MYTHNCVGAIPTRTVYLLQNNSEVRYVLLKHRPLNYSSFCLGESTRSWLHAIARNVWGSPTCLQFGSHDNY